MLFLHVFLIEHHIYIEWTVNLYVCLCKLCMLSVAIFLGTIRKYSCFYFHLSSFFRKLLLRFTQVVFFFTKYIHFYSSSFESNYFYFYFYSSTKKVTRLNFVNNM